MKLASFTIFKNEAPILGAFLDQLAEFFDHKFLVNHESSDASPETVRDRHVPGARLFHLKASGFPPPQLATHFAHRIFKETDADWLFFLDCDEFLPFRSRSDLVKAINDRGASHELLRLRWRNILPNRIDGQDIFSEGFTTLPEKSAVHKMILSRSLVCRAPDLVVDPGGRAVSAHGITPSSAELSDRGLFHIPVQSKYRFAAKIRAAGRTLMGDKSLDPPQWATHWVGYHLEFEQRGLAQFDFAGAALNYPAAGDGGTSGTVNVEFKFDYVKTPYREDFDGLISQLCGFDAPGKSQSFLVYDDQGELLDVPIVDGEALPPPAIGPSEGVAARPSFDFDRMAAGAFYSDLIEPLFSLPLKMPPTAWSGHIPFLFVLSRLMRPRTYVELGVHNGSSLIAAATAARAYQIPCRLYGVDSWEGDDHAGHYEGKSIYRELKTFVDYHFSNVHLIRSYFDDASSLFVPDSIDLLHIDGLHTYDAVKHDFVTWLPKMSPSGVILFHDTTVRDRGFGVYRFWSELERRFTTLQFFHSFGLGVLFLDGKADALQPLLQIVRHDSFREFYQSLVADIGSLIEIRMQYLHDPTGGREIQRLETENQRLEGELRFLRAESAAYKADALSRGLFGLRRALRMAIGR